MTLRTLIRRSLRFHWRSHLGVWLGALVGSAALIGALVVGESVRGSLRERALARLGSIQVALDSGDRLFSADLARRLERRSGNTPDQFVWDGPATATLHLKGTAAKQDGSTRANGVQIYGARGLWSFSRRAEEMLNAVRASHPKVIIQGQWPSESPETERLFRDYTTFLGRPAPGQVLLNRALAEQLQVKRGDTVVLRFPKPSALSQEAVLSPRDQSTAAMRAVVEEILDADSLGEFSLQTGQRPPLNAFLNLSDLWRLSNVTNQANLVVTSGGTIQQANARHTSLRGRFLSWSFRNPGRVPRSFQEAIARSFDNENLPAASDATQRYLSSQVKEHWSLSDAEIEVRSIEQPAPATGGEYIAPMIEVATRRVFLDPVVAEAGLKPRSKLITNNAAFSNDKPADLAEASFVTNGIPLITYLVNAIRFGEKLTPYSMVTAVGAPWTPAGMADDEIVVNEWLANDLGVKAGDRVEMNYFDPESGARLLEKTNSFKVRSVVPMRGLYVDRTLMPEFPGVAKAESTGDWDTGFPLAHTIRNQDEAYWKQYRGTPKAFITLNAGRKMWANRFGEFTAVRYFVPTNGFPPVFRDIVEANLIGNLDPSQLGLVFQPVREQALKAANESQDFGGLFIGFSFFLILAALLLMAMLFSFGIEQRAAEIGTYLAVGFPLKQVRRMFLREGIAIATLGALAGTMAGVFYAKGMLWGLATIWSKAVGESALGLHYSLSTLLGGAVASVLVAALAIWLTLRKQGRQPVRELLAGGGEELERRSPTRRAGVQALACEAVTLQRELQPLSHAGSEIGAPKRSRGWWVGIVSGGLALGMVGFALAQGEAATADTFFSAGALLLVAGLGFTAALLAKLARSADPRRLTLSSLGLRGCARRRNRSLAVAAMLASGSFLILSIGAFRLDADRDATQRGSGTGGFAFIGETTLPVVHDLNTRAGRENYGLNERDLEGVSFVPFRVREGDEASCLNLNRAQQPRLLGVKPELLAERGAFTFGKVQTGLLATNKWLALHRESLPNGPGSLNSPSIYDEFVPAIGDANSIQWAMGKKIGDTIDYVDERGQPFKVRIVGAVANSVLQGQLIIDEAEFIRRFPSGAGHRFFLVDAPAQTATNVSAVLSRALSDVGLEVTPAATRLAQFNAVQNTYLNTFQVLGGLGLLLGSAGLGVVVLRNVLERRGELALLLAVGFTRRLLARLVLAEHAALLAAGLGIGLAAAMIAVLPALISPGAEPPSWSLVALLTGVLANGLVWTWLATRWALRGKLLNSLRNE